MRLRSASVGYGSKTILGGVELEIQAGQAARLHGSNGSGKTTLLRSLLGLQPLLAGSLENTFASTGYVPQAKSLDRSFPISVERMLAMSFPGPLPVTGKRRRHVTERVERALDYVGIQARRNLLLRECSGGELQRALIARALVHEPDFVVMDEPTNSLDQAGRAELVELLTRLKNDGTALLMTTHETDLLPDRLFEDQFLIVGGTIRKSVGSGTALRSAADGGGAHV